MAKLYYNKITREEMNHMTGEVWTVGDVPFLWRDQVQAMLGEDEGA